MKKGIFALLALVISFIWLLLFGVSSEEWDGICSHKLEYGLIAFYRVSHQGVTSGECSTGLLPLGAFVTASICLITLALIYISWVKLVKNGQST